MASRPPYLRRTTCHLLVSKIGTYFEVSGLSGLKSLHARCHLGKSSLLLLSALRGLRPCHCLLQAGPLSVSFFEASILTPICVYTPASLFAFHTRRCTGFPALTRSRFRPAIGTILHLQTSSGRLEDFDPSLQKRAIADYHLRRNQLCFSSTARDTRANIKRLSRRSPAERRLSLIWRPTSAVCLSSPSWYTSCYLGTDLTPSQTLGEPLLAPVSLLDAGRRSPIYTAPSVPRRASSRAKQIAGCSQYLMHCFCSCNRVTNR